MTYPAPTFNLGHTEGVPADTIHRFGHVLEVEFGKIATEFDARGQYIPVTMDNGDESITTGSKGLFYYVRCDGVIKSWTILTDPAVPGSIEIDVRRVTYDTYATTDAGDSITDGNYITLDDAIKGKDDVLTGWTTQLYAGDILELVVHSVDTVKRIDLVIEITR